MTRVLTIALFLIAIAASAVFYGFSKSKDSAQIIDSVLENGEANLLPIAPDKTPLPPVQLQAIAYSNFLHIFGGERQIDFGLVEPVPGFKERITKKSYGLYVTPETSPVHPDKFTGYHTGVDSEFSDTKEEVSVRAITEGKIIFRTWASGYGGVIIIKHYLMGVPVFAIYGHLDKASFLNANITQVQAGQKIGVLGDDHSEETDGARKHLHFSIYAGEKPDIRGYVPNEEDLTNWLNPLDFY